MVLGEDKGTLDTVQVALRIRPLMKQEVLKGCDECIDVVPGEPQVQIKDLAFTYNYVFPLHITQQELYDTAVKGLIGKLFQGYNVTILAYGQTGSGKTYTMGTDYSGSDGDSAKLGVIPRAVSDIFHFVAGNEDQFKFQVNVSYMELYQEQCYDLLSGKGRGHSIIEIREDVNKGVILPGITEVAVASVADTMKALARGSAGRATGSTAMNSTSSRSHGIFTVTIAKESRTDENLCITSKFHLVDLAGSERIKKTQASGKSLREGVKINQGLLALGNVISALGDGTNRSFISYRDSKLTRLLQDSLGGNSLTLMVACVSPADYNLDETVCTLRYAHRARRIRNKPVVNQDPKAAEIKRLNDIINELRLQVIGKLPTVAEQNTEQLQRQLEEERHKYAELLNKHKKITDHLANVLTENTNLCEKALLAEEAKERIEKKLTELTEQCNQTLDNLYTCDRPQEDERQKTTVVDYIKEIKTRLEELQSVSWKIDQDLIDHEIQMALVHAVHRDEEEGVLADEVDDQAAAEEEEKRAMGQMVLNKELQTLNREMAIKASLIQTILADNKEMLENHMNLRETREKIARLEKERDEEMVQLKKTKPKEPSHEKRLTRVSILESGISDLQKRVQQQAEMIKTKKKNRAKIASLGAELQAMKMAKGKLIKQMREESEKYRKWKANNERAMLRLKTKERQRAAAMARMETLHAKQRLALKRKVQETVAVNKRLKEALERQETTQMKRNAKGNIGAGAVQAYVEQELERFVSLAEAESALEQLMEYRALITEQIEHLRNKSDGEVNEAEVAQLEEDLAYRKAQFSDLQQKILIADKAFKSRSQLDNIQCMLDAKVSMKVLFSMLVDAKCEQNQASRGYTKVKEQRDRLAKEFDDARAKFEKQIEQVKMQSDQKVTALVALQRGVVGRSEDSDPYNQLQLVIQTQQERLDAVEEDNKKLMEELEQLRSANNPKTMEYMTLKDLDLTEDEDELGDEDQNDPQLETCRSQLEMNCPEQGPSSTAGASRAVKRKSDGKDKTNNPSSTELTLNSAPSSSADDRNLDSSYVKKKRSYFFPNEQGDDAQSDSSPKKYFD